MSGLTSTHARRSHRPDTHSRYRPGVIVPTPSRQFDVWDVQRSVDDVAEDLPAAVLFDHRAADAQGAFLAAGVADAQSGVAVDTIRAVVRIAVELDRDQLIPPAAMLRQCVGQAAEAFLPKVAPHVRKRQVAFGASCRQPRPHVVAEFALVEREPLEGRAVTLRQRVEDSLGQRM